MVMACDFQNFCSSHLHAHQPNYYSNLHVMFYFVEYNNSIPFSKEQLHQANKSFCNRFNPIACRPHVHLGTKLEVLIGYFIEK